MALKNQKGQLTIEAILLMVVLTAAVLAGTRYLREQKVVATIVEGPWDRTAGMIESGVWLPAAQARQKQPYQYDRFYTPHAQ